MRIEPRDSPQYVEQLEAMVCLQFTAMVLLEATGPAALREIAMTIDTTADMALSIMDRVGQEVIGRATDPVVREWLRARKAAQN